MKEYMKLRYWERRRIGVEVLGGKCVRCGSKEKLEFDHVDRATKGMSTARMTMVSMPKFLEELSKCQLLCDPCHTRKTQDDLGRKYSKGTHGNLSGARYCKPRCELCRTAQREYDRDYRKRKQSLPH